LGGEGLQHQDGSSHLVAATIPNCKAYDPAFAGELAIIVDQGMREMLVDQKDVFYYITLMNENHAQPDLPQGVSADLLRGCYRFASWSPSTGVGTGKGQASKPQTEPRRVSLLGSGAILSEVIKAAELLLAQGIGVDVFSVTSWSELARQGQACEAAELAGAARMETPFIAQQLALGSGPIVAATDYVRAVPESIRAFVPAGRSYTTLGTDGFGRSDTRSQLRQFFKVDAASIAATALRRLG
jgi:pyruvate dehydrogenase E1 component